MSTADVSVGASGGGAGPSGAPKPAPASADTAATTKRLQSELMALMSSADPGVSAFPSGDSLFAWTGTISGPEGTAYEGLTYRLAFSFPPEYPFSPPAVRFDCPCFHPNVDAAGNICLDILQDKWSAAFSVRTVLLSLQSLLQDANTASPLNAYAASLWASPEEYRALLLAKAAGGEQGV